MNDAGQTARSQTLSLPAGVPPVAGNDGRFCGVGDTRIIYTVRTLCFAHLLESNEGMDLVEHLA